MTRNDPAPLALGRRAGEGVTPPRLIAGRWYKRASDDRVRQCVDVETTERGVKIWWRIPTLPVGALRRFAMNGGEYRMWSRKGDVEAMPEGWTP